MTRTDSAVTPATSEPAEATPGSIARVGRSAVRAAVVLFVLVMVATATYLAIERRQSTELEQAREQATAAARDHVVIIASYDSRELDSYFAAVQEIATGDFARKYDEAENLRLALEETQTVVSAEVIDAGIESAAVDRVVVLLFVDQEVRNLATNETTSDQKRMRMTLERDAQGWLVSDVELR